MHLKLKAHSALLTANVLYGVNYVVAKGIMPDYMTPRAIIFMRISGALMVFWLIHHFLIKEKIQKKDLGRLALCGLFGVAINQILFFEGLNLTTPINASIIMTSGPILALVFSYLILKELINIPKIIGIVLGSIGAGTLILMGGDFSFNSDTIIGNALILTNASSYSLFLVIVKPLRDRYSTFTIMKWVFIFGFLWSIPFCIGPFINTDFQAIPPNIWASIIYVMIGPTILAYLLNNYALGYVSPVVNSSYIYTQPAIAALVAIIYMQERLTLLEVGCAALIFAGVYLVSIKKTRLQG